MLNKAAVYLISVYQRSISICLPDTCRFTPSCSEYAKQVLLKYGFLRGGFKALLRLFSCHPFYKVREHNSLG